MKTCGAGISLAPNIVVYCERGEHSNQWYHEGLLAPGSHWKVRWEPIANLLETPPTLIPVKGHVRKADDSAKPPPEARMSTDALVALLEDLPELLDRAANRLWDRSSEDRQELGRILKGRAVRLRAVLPADHPLRTGEPTEEIVRLADDAHDAVVARLLDEGAEVGPQEPMRAAVRVVLGLLREGL